MKCNVFCEKDYILHKLIETLSAYIHFKISKPVIYRKVHLSEGDCNFWEL